MVTRQSKTFDPRGSSVIPLQKQIKECVYFLFVCRYTFASGSADNIKQWMFPDGNFIQNLSGHNAIINTLAVNSDGVLVSGGINNYLQCSFFSA